MFLRRSVSFWLVLVLTAFVVIQFLSLPYNPLITDDASLYAISIKNTVLYNQWLAPLITPGDIHSFIDKPPLGIWLMAVFPKIFGINEVTVHIGNVFFFSMILLFGYLILKKVSSKKIALYSILILSTSIVGIVYSRAPKLDILISLFLMVTHLWIYQFLKTKQVRYLYFSAIAIGLGFLVKSGFAIVFPGLTVLFLFWNKNARKSFLDFIFSWHILGSLMVLFSVIGLVLGGQYFAFQGLWPTYIRSILVQSKYNIGYLGLGFNFNSILFLMITIFPWSFLFLASLKNPFSQKLNLNQFCQIWFFSNLLFLVFFFQQTDFRSFTMIMAPLSIIAAHRLISLFYFSISKKKDYFWIGFFVSLVGIGLISLIVQPIDPTGNSRKAIILPLIFLFMGLIFSVFLIRRPKPIRFLIVYVCVFFGFSVLFFQTRSFANGYNQYLAWPKIIKQYQKSGNKYYIYRPLDRDLKMSLDLCYVDFMSGGADRYFWDSKELLKSLVGNDVLLSDRKSWEKLGINGEVIVQDKRDVLVVIKGIEE